MTVPSAPTPTQPWSQEVLDEARAINAACVRALRMELGEMYRGVLYGGYMITPKVGAPPHQPYRSPPTSP